MDPYDTALDLSDDERRVLDATAAVEADAVQAPAGDDRAGPYLPRIAERAGMAEDAARATLSSLMDRNLVEEDRTERPGDPDLGPRYRVRQRAI